MGSQLLGSLDIITLGLDHGGDTASEPPAGLCDEVPGHDCELLPDGDVQRGLDGMRTSINMSLEMAPDKIVNRIKIWAARGPHVLRHALDNPPVLDGWAQEAQDLPHLHLTRFVVQISVQT